MMGFFKTLIWKKKERLGLYGPGLELRYGPFGPGLEILNGPFWLNLTIAHLGLAFQKDMDLFLLGHGLRILDMGWWAYFFY
jgi:hypothetical protein